MKTKYARHFQNAIICEFNALNPSERALYKTSKELHLLHVFIIGANGGRRAVYVGCTKFDWICTTQFVVGRGLPTSYYWKIQKFYDLFYEEFLVI